MKVVFAPEELHWLHFATGVYASAARQSEDKAQANLAIKVRYKMTPNSSYVSLSGKERELIKVVTAIAVQGLKPGAEEVPVLKSILTKLGVIANDSNQTDARES